MPRLTQIEILQSRLSSLRYSLRPWRLAIIMTAFLLLGGTSQAAPMVKLPLYLLALFFIAATLTSSTREPLGALKKTPLLLGAAFIVLFALYLLPLPYGLWSSLPNRTLITDGFSAAGLSPRALALSITPEDTMMTIWSFLPPICVACIVLLDRRKGEVENTLKTILALSALACVWGLIQMLIGAKALYPYAESAFGRPVGMFSNTNHFAFYLAMVMPIGAYFFTRRDIRSSASDLMPPPIKVLSGFFLVLAAATIALTTSLAGYITAAAVIGLCVLGLRKRTKPSKLTLITLAALVAFFIVDFFILGQFGAEFIGKFAGDNTPLSRMTAFETVTQKMDLFSLFGTGPGSFYDVYLSLENRDTMTTRFFNQAHNDYLQVLMEMGILGLLIVVAGTLWALWTMARLIIQGPRAQRLAVISSIGLFVVLLSSLSDYPLRTITISVMATLFICLAIKPKRS